VPGFHDKVGIWQRLGQAVPVPDVVQPP